MQKKRGLWINFIFSLIGVLFAGYLSYGKLISGTCPISEGCTMLFGLPVCIYGLVMFGVLLVLSGLMLFRKTSEQGVKRLTNGLLVVSALGILFSLYYSIIELFLTPCLGGVCKYSLLLPSCTYGLVMYIVILVNSWLNANNNTKRGKK
jgi:hypothetical protein